MDENFYKRVEAIEFAVKSDDGKGGADQLVKILTERLKEAGLPFGAKYSAIERVAEELEYAFGLYKQLGCTVINVTEKAIEETAGIILDAM